MLAVLSSQLRIFGLEFRCRKKHDRPPIIYQRHYTLYIFCLNLRFDGLGSFQRCTHIKNTSLSSVSAYTLQTVCHWMRGYTSLVAVDKNTWHWQKWMKKSFSDDNRRGQGWNAATLYAPRSLQSSLHLALSNASNYGTFSQHSNETVAHLTEKPSIRSWKTFALW